MENAILKTLVYGDIFDYPLKAYEIHKWLIGNQVYLQQIEKALNRLRVKGKVGKVKDYYVLSGRSGLIKKRQDRKKQSKKYLLKAKFCAFCLKIIPTLKLVGISGGLALNNAEGKDDIDLFLITEKNRLWITRLLAFGILDFWGVRRGAKMSEKQAAGKICVNILVEEDRVEQENKDLFVAHEVLQMKVLWQRGGTYKKYLEKNKWAFEYLPNWMGDEIKSSHVLFNWIPAFLEKIAQEFQLMIMQKPKGMERIEEGALYFHPNDKRIQVLKEFKQKVKNLSNT